MATFLLVSCCEDFDGDIAGHDGKRNDNWLKTKLHGLQNKQDSEITWSVCFANDFTEFGTRHKVPSLLNETTLSAVSVYSEVEATSPRNSSISKIELITEMEDSRARIRATAKRGRRLSNVIYHDHAGSGFLKFSKKNALTNTIRQFRTITVSPRGFWVADCVLSLLISVRCPKYWRFWH